MEKETVKIVIIGHVDHGKSTLIGRLLLDTNSLPKEKLTEIKKISKELGKETELAYLVDQLKEERERNATIDTTQIFFKTRKRNYVIIDTPGHVEFIKNMITGASLAQIGVLIVDVQEGVMEQTRRHAYIISMLGIDKVIVVFNKMDLVNYERERFNKVRVELLKFLESLKITPFFTVPASAKEGDNICMKSSKMSWYKGPGLLGALNSLKLNIKTTKKPLRFPIQDIYEIEGEKIIVGRIISGIIKQGQKVILLPSFKAARIKIIKVFGKRRRTAREGENIGLTLSKPVFVERGEVVAQKENPPKATDHFKGNILWMSYEPLQINKTMILRCATQEIECTAERIEKRINSSTLEIIEENAMVLKLNEAGVVIFKTQEPIVVEKFNFIEELGRFIIEREHDLKGIGIVTENNADRLNEGSIQCLN
jgi:sulfate adenylyltransferase large subunit